MRSPTVLSALSFPFTRSFAQPLSALCPFFWMLLLLLPSPLVRAQTGAGTPAAAQVGAEARTLKPGEPVERELAGGEQHAYQITLNEGQYLNVVVEQRGIDVTVSLSGPDGKHIGNVNDEGRKEGAEKVEWVAAAAGSYQLKVQAPRGMLAGKYEIRVAELREATERDRALQEAQQLTVKFDQLFRAAKYDEARPLAEQVLELREKTLGSEHPDVARALFNLAHLYQDKGDYSKAEPLYQRALAIREKVLGAEHLDVATTLNQLAILYRARRDYAKAEPLYQRALAIREKVLGAEHPDVANSLNNLANLYNDKRDFAKAEPLYLRALATREKVLGAEHPDVATSLSNLAIFYRDKGDTDKAEPLYLRALAIREKVWGAEHPDVANSLNHLAIFVYREKGDAAKAEPLYQRALAINEKTRGKEHPLVAASLNNLANLYRDTGDYIKAEPLYQRALAISEKTLGAEHPDLSSPLGNLAALYSDKGDFAKAEPLQQRALAIREKALGPQHPFVASSLNELGNLYLAQGNYAKAEPLFRRALAISEKALGTEHLLVAVSLSNIGHVLRAKGDYDKAEPLFQRALAIAQKAFGAEHSNVATALNNLALLYHDKMEHAKAEPLYQRALAIREKAFGARHPDVARALKHLAQLYQSMDEVAKAIEFQARVSRVSEHNLALNLTTGSERQKLAYLVQFTGESNQTISLHVRAAPTEATARNLALTTILQRKGRALDAMTDSLAALRRRANADDRALLDQLQGSNAQLAGLVLKGPQRITPAEHQARIRNLEEQKEKLEGEISRRSAGFRAQATPVTIEAVQAAIPAQAALVEYVSFRPFNAKSQKAAERFGPPRYVAYVLHQRGEAQWVELGEAKAIDEAVEKLRQALRDRRRRDVKQLARRVDEKVMQPVRALLGSTRRVLIAPDGALNLAPFAALVDEQGRYLVRRYEFSYLTSGRDLLRLPVKQPGKRSAMVLADPAFGDLPGAEKAQERRLKYRPASSASAPTTGNASILADAYFPPLSGTAGEARALTALLPGAVVLTRARATEAALKQAGSPDILHVATHGFFLEDATTPAAERGWPSSAEAPETATVENPLLRSGLALAGANLRRSGPNQADDGILTAQEAAGLDLWGTKLVVLSACDTGVGEVKNGEGVYGLRRALVLAGSETQVMSLWPVSDRVTRDLMIEYYRRLLKGEGRSAALRQVQLRMLQAKSRRQPGQKARPKDYSHPFYWAGFIQSGEWANLEGKR
jgi:CHAT domain-containing protein